jgi:hypothetical protein
MPSIDRADPVILGHVLAQHRDLFNLMQSVRAGLAATACPGSPDCACLLDSLRRLRGHLHDHFAQEEAGGFLEESVARVPRLSAAMRAVVGQHPALLAEIDAVIAGLDDGNPSAAAWANATAAFDRFAEHMKEHEQRENAVVQEGYNENLGLVE